MFVDVLSEECERFKMSAELIMVEWNPPAERPSLSEALVWPAASYLTIRIITVPQAIHRELKNSDKLEMYQMIAKNVGIRRARGEFVLATNVDVLLSQEMVAFIAKKQLNPKKYYRADRYDVQGNIPVGSLDSVLKFCRDNVLRISRKEATYDLASGNIHWIYSDDPVVKRVRSSPVFIGLMAVPATLWRRIDAIAGLSSKRSKLRRRSSPSWSLHGGWVLFRNRLPRLSTGLVGRHPFDYLDSAHLEVEMFLMRPSARPRVPALGASRGIKRILQVFADSFRPNLVPERRRLHTNACGDFTLMSRRAWYGLRGYPEFEGFSIHLDSVLLYEASYRGLEEECVSYPIYHLDHLKGWSPVTLAGEEYLARLRQRGIPYLTYNAFLDSVEQLARGRVTPGNNEGWGLGGVALKERKTGGPTGGFSIAMESGGRVTEISQGY